MILTCPACSTRYQADEAKFPPQGRTVRCVKCGHSWRQSASQQEPEVSPLDGAAYAPQQAVASPLSTAHARRPDTEARAAPQGRGLQTLGVGVGWLGLIVAVLLIGYSAVRYRQDVTAIWPQSAALYSGLGLGVNTNGIDFRGVSYKRENEDGLPVLEVVGLVVNTGGRELPVPQTVRVTLSDADNRELYHWSFRPGAGTLKAGQSIPFRTRLSSPPAAARHLEVRFAKDGS